MRLPFRKWNGNIIEWNTGHGECNAHLFGDTLDGKVGEFGTRSAVAEEEGACFLDRGAHDLD